MVNRAYLFALDLDPFMEERPLEQQNSELVERLKLPEENLAAFFRNIRGAMCCTTALIEEEEHVHPPLGGEWQSLLQQN